MFRRKIHLCPLLLILSLSSLHLPFSYLHPLIRSPWTFSPLAKQFYQLPRDWSGSDQPAIPWLLLLAVLDNRSCFSTVFWHFSPLPWSVKGYWEWSDKDICQLPQRSWEHHIRDPWHNIRSVCLYPDLIIFHQGYIFLAPAFPSSLWDLQFLEAGLASEDCGKEGIQYLSLFYVLYKQISHLIKQWIRISSSLPIVVHVLTEALFVVLDILGQIQSHIHFSFLFPWMMFLYTSQVTCSCLRLVYTSSFVPEFV